jgi:hypothetical protein
VLIRGKVDTRDDRPKILAESVETIEETDEDLAIDAADALDTSYATNTPDTSEAQMAYPLNEVEDDVATYGESALVLTEVHAVMQSMPEPNTAPVADVPAPAVVLEIAVERTAQPDRDVSRLSRLSQLLEDSPGPDTVVVRLGHQGREVAALRLREGVSCTRQLVERIRHDLGDVQVRVRQPEGAILAA